MLERLARITVDAGYAASSNTPKRRFLEGTRSDLLGKLTSWVDPSAQGLRDKPICILTGAAGTGKSTIASELCQRLKVEGKLGASFFFARNDNDLNSIKAFFVTLAYQLARSQEALRSHIIAGEREYRRSGSSPDMNLQAQYLFTNPIVRAEGQVSPVVIVIEALDECTDHAQELLPEMLGTLFACARQAHFPLRIAITARPRTYIDRILDDPQFSSIIHRLSLDTVPTDLLNADVATFLRHQLSQLPSGQQLFEDHPDIVERLTQRVEGSFPFARSLMDYVKGDPCHIYEQLGAFLLEGPSKAILQPLDDMYRDALEQAFPSERLAIDRLQHARVRPILGYIAIAQEPISPRTLETLVRVPCADAIAVLNELRSVVRFERDSVDATFYPTHGTFAQFLLDGTRSTKDVYSVDGQEEHERLAEGCLRVLLSLSRNICQLPERDLERPKREVFDLADRVRRYVPPHVRYASAHWATHLAASRKTRELAVLFRKFAGENLLMWMETLGYIGKLDHAAGALAQAQAWLEVRNSALSVRAVAKVTNVALA